MKETKLWLQYHEEERHFITGELMAPSYVTARTKEGKIHIYKLDGDIYLGWPKSHMLYKPKFKVRVDSLPHHSDLPARRCLSDGYALPSHCHAVKLPECLLNELKLGKVAAIEVCFGKKAQAQCVFSLISGTAYGWPEDAPEVGFNSVIDNLTDLRDLKKAVGSIDRKFSKSVRDIYVPNNNWLNNLPFSASVVIALAYTMLLVLILFGATN